MLEKTITSNNEKILLGLACKNISIGNIGYG
jgi:hypothetical protein